MTILGLLKYLHRSIQIYSASSIAFACLPLPSGARAVHQIIIVREQDFRFHLTTEPWAPCGEHWDVQRFRSTKRQDSYLGIPKPKTNTNRTQKQKHIKKKKTLFLGSKKSSPNSQRDRWHLLLQVHSMRPTAAELPQVQGLQRIHMKP